MGFYLIEIKMVSLCECAKNGREETHNLLHLQIVNFVFVLTLCLM